MPRPIDAVDGAPHRQDARRALLPPQAEGVELLRGVAA